ncbi:MAG: branched-chain amino acid ABC transporter permease [Deltaproteobacteria bacterium]|nr:branched-chain amino acid ABC transporter permease [Deltaproteobacteria bacterium]
MQDIVNIVVLGSLYCLICCGYVLIYRASRVLNLAHGEIMSLGAYFLFTVAVSLGSHPALSFICAIVMSLVLGLVIYQFLMRFMAGESAFAAVLVTIAMGILLRGLTTLIWTSQDWYPLQYLGIENASHSLMGGGVISTFGIIALVSFVVLYAGLFTSFKFTRWGLRMRAVGENPLFASQRGIRLHWYYAVSWALASFSAGVAGMIQACDFGLNPGMFHIGLKAFSGVVVAGLDSPGGGVPAAVIVCLGGVPAL